MDFDPKLLNAFACFKGWREMDREEKQAYARNCAPIVKSEHQARRIIEIAVKNSKFLPSIAELAEIAETVPTQASTGGGCEHCGYSGRVSEWYLWTVERHPSGDVKRRTRELIPSDGSPCWLMYEPNIPTGKNQQIALCNDFCTCDLGMRMKAGYLRYRSDAA